MISSGSVAAHNLQSEIIKIKKNPYFLAAFDTAMMLEAKNLINIKHKRS